MQLSETATNLAFSSLDQASEILEQGADTFSPFILLVNKHGSSSKTKLLGDEEQVSQLAQQYIDEQDSTVVAYAIIQDANVEIQGQTMPTMVVEVGCAITGNTAKMLQFYQTEPFQEIDNVKMLEGSALRIQPTEQQRTDTENQLASLFQAPFAVLKIALNENKKPQDELIDAFTTELNACYNSQCSVLVKSCIEYISANSSQHFSLLNDPQFDALETFASAKHILGSSFSGKGDTDYINLIKSLSLLLINDPGLQLVVISSFKN